MIEDASAFLAVCQHGSLSAAGRSLGVAPSTVGRRIGALEARLGAKLLDRSTRGLSLTEAGRVFRDRALIGRDLLLQAEDEVRSMMGRPTGRLRIAVPSALIRGLVADVVIAYARAYPEVAIEIVGTDEDVVPDGIELHLAVRASRVAPPAPVIQRKVGVVEMCVCASPEWIARHPPLSDPDQLREIGCVVLGSHPSAARVRLTRGDEVWAHPVRAALFTTSLTMARRAGIAGIGPVGLPAASCSGLIAQGVLEVVLPAWRLDPVDVVVLTADRRQRPAKIQAFLHHLATALAPAGGTWAPT